MDTKQQYEALRGAAVFASTRRTLIDVSGSDRASFLHNLCTNDVRKLEPGQGCEAFFTNVQGKVLCHSLLFCRSNSIVIDSTHGHAEMLLPHLDKYLIREDVTLSDQSGSGVLVLAGPESRRFLEQRGVQSDLAMLAHGQHDLRGVETQVRRVPLATVPSFLLICEQEQLTKLRDLLRNASICEVDADVMEVARIEAGFPASGRDISADNLPQEVGRDQLAISFTKGCYLGQETVARIDALGHVNRRLVLLEFDGVDVPPDGTELMSEEKVVGKVTSACLSPKLQRPIALGYVRREVIENEVQLTGDFGSARVTQHLAGG